MNAAAPSTLAAVRSDSTRAVFPTDLLAGQETALLLFCAGFYGRSDGIHVWDAGIPHVTGVDIDGTKLDVMRMLYPGWTLIEADVYSWASRQSMFTVISTAAIPVTPPWDIVILDPQINQAERCYELLPLWCKLARNAVVLGTMRGTIERDHLHRLDCPALPDGWYLDRVTARNDTAHWIVARPDNHHPPRPHRGAA